MSDDIFDRLDELVTKQRGKILALEAELAATRRQADAASIDLHNRVIAHQEELAKAAMVEIRLTDRVAQLEAESSKWYKAAHDGIDGALEHGVREVSARDERIAALEQLVEQLRCGDLDAFHDGELSPERAAAFREHLGRCAKCDGGLADLLYVDMVAATSDRGPPR